MLFAWSLFKARAALCSLPISSSRVLWISVLASAPSLDQLLHPRATPTVLVLSVYTRPDALPCTQ